MSLFGSRTIHCLPYLIYAVESMARRGLGFALTPFALEEVLFVNERNERASVYAPHDAGAHATRIAPHRAAVCTLYESVAQRLAQIKTRGLLTLHFITPTWIEVRKELLKSVTCEQLFRRLSWRVSRLFELYSDAPLTYDHQTLIARAATIETVSENLWMHRFERYSNRRQEKTPMHGFLGEVTYQGHALEELLPLIIAGEFLQFGKETAFGLGRYFATA